MWWVIISVCVCAAAATNELSCPDRADCRLFTQRHDGREFLVEGHYIDYRLYEETNRRGYPLIYMSCRGWEALDSPALPRFTNKYYLSRVVFDNCPPPRNGSFESVLARCNVVQQVFNDELSLELLYLPENASLTAQHFVGDKKYTNIRIGGKSDALQQPLPEAGFLSSCQNLRDLRIDDVRLPAGELERLPRSITSLTLGGQTLDILPTSLPEIMEEISRAMPTLPDLLLLSSEYTASSPKIAKKLNTTVTTRSTLRSLHLHEWNQKSMMPFEHCDVLQSLWIEITKVEELPDRWVECPQLEVLDFSTAPQLTSLPAKLLDGAVRLSRLQIVNTKIESLPDGFFDGVPNLRELDLSGNRLRTISSATFQGLRLRVLSLRSNKLTSESLNVLAPMTALEDLDLGENEDVHDVCEPNGYSPLQNLTKLELLNLEHTSITRVCRDWRVNFRMLKNLLLAGTKIVQLHFEDILHPRYEAVGEATVEFSNTVTSIELTEEYYKTAVAAPGPLVTIKFRSDEGGNQTGGLACDCRAYWLRRVVDSGSRAIRIEGLICSDGRKFESVALDEMCPEPKA